MEVTNNDIGIKKDSVVFYHGGVSSDFSIDKIDIYRIAEKQNTKNRGYAGFYMFDEEKRDKAFHYAEQRNSKLNVSDRGVVKLVLSNDLNIYKKEGYCSIDRMYVEELRKYSDLGYDLIAGKSYEGEQYILLNKDKIKAMEFESMDMRYKKENKFKDNLKKSVSTDKEFIENALQNSSINISKEIEKKGR